MKFFRLLKYYLLVLLVYCMFVPFILASILENLWYAVRDAYYQIKRDTKDMLSHIKHIKQKYKSYEL